MTDLDLKADEHRARAADGVDRNLWVLLCFVVVALFMLNPVSLVLTMVSNAADVSGVDEGRVATSADVAWFSEVLYWVMVISVAGLVVSAVVLLIRTSFRDIDLEPIPAIAGWVERVDDTFVVTSDDGEVWVLDPAKVRHTSVIIDPSIQTGYLRNDSAYHRSLVLPPRVWKAYRRALRWGR